MFKDRKYNIEIPVKMTKTVFDEQGTKGKIIGNLKSNRLTKTKTTMADEDILPLLGFNIDGGGEDDTDSGEIDCIC